MSNKNTKEKVQKILKRPEKIRGEVFRTDAKYIIEKEGKEGLKKVKKQAEKMGASIPYEEAESLEWYPVGLRMASFMVIIKVLDWREKDIRKMGYNALKTSFIVKLIAEFFLSLERILEKSPQYWDKYYTIGKLETAEVNMEEKYCIGDPYTEVYVAWK